MTRSRIAAPALVALAAIIISSGPLGGQPALASSSAVADSRESVLVTGTGSASGTPDTLTADFGVETDAPTISQALESANVAANGMRDALVHAGIARADLQTSNFTIGSKLNDKQELIGYTVSQGLTVKIRNLQRAGDLLSAAIAAGGDAARFNGVSFAIENNAALLTKARKNAFADARQKAELYANAAGRPLGRVLQVTETAPSYGAPFGLHSPMAMDSRLLIEPGQQQLTANVTVEWAFGPSPKPAQPAITPPAV